MSAMSVTASASATGRGQTSKPAIAASMLGVFICLLDTNIVNVALPDIQRSLGGGLSDSQWIVSLYVLALAALIVPAGILGDLHDIRLLFGAGALVFGAGSLVCALAGNGWSNAVGVIFVGRVVQGVGAALTLPLSLAMIFVYAVPGATVKLIALWSAISGLSTAVGPLVGGLVVQHLGWKWIFLLNLPIVAVEVVLLVRTPAPAVQRRDRIPHLASTGAFAAATFALTLAVIQGPSWGWGSTTVIAMFVLSVVLGATFVVLESRSSRPLVPTSLRREREFRSSLLTGFATGLSAFSLFFFLSYYLQYGAGLGPTATGLRFLPMSAMLVLFAGAGRKVSARLGLSNTIGVGMLICSAGLALLWVTLNHQHPSTLSTVLPTMVIGVGVGLSFPATSAQAFAHSSGSDYGTAASVLTMTRQLGNSIGIGVLGLIMTHYAGHGLNPGGVREGLRWIGLASAALAALAGVFNLLTGKRRPVASSSEGQSR
ncbi:MFS transporter [Jatrophihabitans lederbergiae]|uniref:MFS transporter n=1 Tax=Jatrophihabitans lederbergiae TaxID=3075547 RepID=A0ABU2JA63_9ACTN|nr:MFS transporter [Jatrophihabitans sp. DSM 44399]MDT0261613.1 MFS transporter [Jatrophihabitans sp. DSM 44399]